MLLYYHSHTQAHTYTNTHTHTHTHTHIDGNLDTGLLQLARGRCLWKHQDVRGRINILKVLKATGPGQVSLETPGRPGLDKHSQKLLARGRCLWKHQDVREEKGLAQRQDRGRCLWKHQDVRFGTKAGLKPVHDGTIFYSIYL